MTPVTRWPALITAIFVVLAGPQATLLPSAVDFLRSGVAQDSDCQASMCTSRECCCAGTSESGCRIGPSSCPSSDNMLPAVAKGVLPPFEAAGLPRERSASLTAARTAPADDGFDRRPDRPPRASS